MSALGKRFDRYEILEQASFWNPVTRQVDETHVKFIQGPWKEVLAKFNAKKKASGKQLVLRPVNDDSDLARRISES